MSNEILILEKLEKLEQRIGEQNLLMKEVLNFNDACNYLDISASPLQIDQSEINSTFLSTR